MTDLATAKKALSGHTLALVKDGELITSDKRGVAPMVDFLREGKDLSGFSAADKVVGKAAAVLFVKAGIKEIYAETVSQSAKELLEKHKVSLSFGILAPYIVNRDKTGMCPMENAVLSVSDIDGCVGLIFEKLDSLRGKQSKK